MAKDAEYLLRRRLRTLATGQMADDRADQDLLECFVHTHDEAAFATLLERHGPMVLGVCRRVLQDEHLAEDVLQATFLVLARNAAGIRKRRSLGGWLHGVAGRLARKARAEAARAGRGDARPVPEAPPGPAAEASWREVRQILDNELQRLPESYRLPLVLCYLEGRTRDEAAATLGWTPGRLKGLLERGRERLRGRLIRRGLAPGAVGPVLLAETALAAPVPPLLTLTTLRLALRLASGEGPRECGVSDSVARLMEGGLGIMRSKKVLLSLMLALGLGALGTGAGLLAQRPQPGPSSGSAAGPEARTPARQPDKGKTPADGPQRQEARDKDPTKPGGEPLIPPPLNALLPKIVAGMKAQEVRKLLATAYPKVTYHQGVWSGQTGYFDFKLDDRYTVSVAAGTDPKRGDVVHKDGLIYIFDHPKKLRLEIKRYHWQEK
jgi:RNA polymerase sigma factor (sigma-70 family)